MVWVLVIAFVAGLIQGAAGFGLALVAMPLFVPLLGIRVATPLMALLGVGTGILFVFRYRATLDVRAVAKLILAAFVGMPVGVLLLERVDAGIVTRGLGVLLLVYALYALFVSQLPELVHPRWGWLFGFVSGVLNGAYAVPGPPVIVYGSCKRWETAVFKSNLQTYFLVTGLFLLVSHAVSGNFTAVVWQNFLWAIPGALAGLVLGFQVDQILDAQRFQRLVLVLLIGLSVQLILG